MCQVLKAVVSVTTGTEKKDWWGDWVDGCVCDAGGLWGARALDVNESEGHLSSPEKGWEGVIAKAEEKREEVAGSSLHHSRCLLFSSSTAWQLTIRQTPLQPCPGCSPPNYLPFRRGPPETFVPFISTTNTYRCSKKEDAETQRIFWAHASPADSETICFFVNKQHAEELMRAVVSLFKVNMDS